MLKDELQKQREKVVELFTNAYNKTIDLWGVEKSPATIRALLAHILEMQIERQVYGAFEGLGPLINFFEDDEIGSVIRELENEIREIYLEDFDDILNDIIKKVEDASTTK